MDTVTRWTITFTKQKTTSTHKSSVKINNTYVNPSQERESEREREREKERERERGGGREAEGGGEEGQSKSKGKYQVWELN